MIQRSREPALTMQRGERRNGESEAHPIQATCALTDTHMVGPPNYAMAVAAGPYRVCTRSATHGKSEPVAGVPRGKEGEENEG